MPLSLQWGRLGPNMNSDDLLYQLKPVKVFQKIAIQSCITFLGSIFKT